MKPTVVGPLRTVPKRLGKINGRIENQRMKRAYPDYNIIDICQNTEKSPVHLRRLAVSQTLVNDRQLLLV